MIVKRTKTEKKRIAIRAKSVGRRYEISVRKTNNHFYGVVYDMEGKNIVFSTSSLNLKEGEKTSNKDAAQKVGLAVASELKNRKIDSVFFNKLTYQYHGKLASFVDAIRSQGFAI